MITYQIVDAHPLKDYKVEVVFDNLKKGTVDLKKYLGEGIFAELKNMEKFKQFRVDAESGTICWDNGADIAPDTLYADIFGRDSI